MVRVPIMQNDADGEGVVLGRITAETAKRRSTIGTMVPRRLITPLRKCGALAMRDGVLVATDFLHLQDVDAVLFVAQAEGQVLAASVVCTSSVSIMPIALLS